ncbi:MAG: peptidylprolyl isomerase [Gemmatimonadetes bacterium]|nr:peptidylprolyl isomerase [Gemmatimonadota bacterium]
MSRPTWLALAVAGLALAPPAMRAQDAGTVETLARVLAAEDARRFEDRLLLRALSDPDSSVRAIAAVSAGRVGDPRAIALLAPALSDPDSQVQVAAAFALGLLRDTTAGPALVRRAQDGTHVSTPLALEMITAAARIGGRDGAGLVRGVLERTLWGDRSDADPLAWRAALESWRLGAAAPVDALIPMLQDPKEDARYGAAYSLGRLRVPAAAPRLIERLGDRASAQVRAIAARALTRSYVDSARMAREPVIDLLARTTRDEDPGVRIQALRSLGTFQAAAATEKVLPALNDPVANVQIQAAETFGLLGGTAAIAELARHAGATRGTWALRRESLLSLARLDSTRFDSLAARWAASADWRDRAAAARGAARINPARLGPFLDDRDPRVAVAALGAWIEAGDAPDAALLAACRRLLRSRDAALRSLAADGLARAADPGDRAALVVAYRAAARDSFPDAAISALGALRATLDRMAEGADLAERALIPELGGAPDDQVRRWAEEHWPAAAESFGPAFPFETGRTLQDYREAARLFLVGQGPERYPTVRVELEQGGILELELFGPEAPLTVLQFLQLVDRRYFDGQRFHRVVPGFVVQAGDPRGDGWGGPGTTIRDEINRRRYVGYMVGMALSGPDTGGSQWFITLGPQPHLDGTYTVFGRVRDGMPALLRLTEGDQIRSIRR